MEKGPTTEAYEAVNEIRRRAGVDEIENYDYQNLNCSFKTREPGNCVMKGIADSTWYGGASL